MADYAPMSEIRRPAVSVLIVRGRSVDLQSVFWGMEEEGIPFEVQECPSGEAVGVAKEAAQMSPLNVGIGVDGTKGTIVLHHRDLPADQPLVRAQSARSRFQPVTAVGSQCRAAG